MAGKKNKVINLPTDNKDPKHMYEHRASTKVDDMGEFIARYKGEYDTARNGSQEWSDNQIKWYKKRYGIRPPQTFPWWGASNLHLPLQDKTVRKLKPEYVGIIWNASPICDFVPKGAQDLERAERASWHFDWLMRTQVKPFAEICIAADKVMQKGFFLMKTIYEKKIEPQTIVLLRDELIKELQKRLIDPSQSDILSDPSKIDLLFKAMSGIWGFDPENEIDMNKMIAIANELYKGTEAIEFTIEQVVTDSPKLLPLDPEDVTVPVGTESILDLEKAEWIDHMYTVTPAQLWADVLSGKWNKKVALEILSKKGIDPNDLADSKFKNIANKSVSNSELEKNTREGLNEAEQTNAITLHEVCLWYDSDGDGMEERHILDYGEDYMDDALRFIKYPLDMKCWPYVKVPFEITDNRHYSPRGTVQIQDPLASALNIQENQKINRQTLATTPTLFYAPGKFNPKNMKFIPGQPVQVQFPVSQSVQWMLPPGGDQSYIYEEAALKTWGEEVIGSPDSSASRLNVGGTSRKTATEMTITGNESITTRQLDLEIFQAAFALIYERLWSLWMQYGPEELVSYVSSDGRPQAITKGEMFGSYLFTPGGRFGAQNPVLEAQKAFRRFELFNNDPFIDQYELRRQMLAKEDVRMADALLKSKEQLAQEAQSEMQAQQMQKQEDLQTQLILAQAGAKAPAKNKQNGKPRQKGASTEITGGQINGGANLGPRRAG